MVVIMSSAARTLGRAAMCARALRAAQDDAESFRDARDELAGTLRTEALRVLVINGIPAQAREDLAQAVTLTVLGRIVEGAVEPGFEDGYLAVAAKNRARDWHREKSGVYEKTEAYEEDLLPAPDLDPHAALEHAEEENDARALTDRVVAVLHKAPARYRDVLVAVYLEGVAIDTLVDQELFREWPWSGADTAPVGDDPIATRRRARARVDKLLQRARDWVRARVLANPNPKNEIEMMGSVPSSSRRGAGGDSEAAATQHEELPHSRDNFEHTDVRVSR
jgi:DNA-directed RNA polymerase specialized sigma24 family protein